MIDNNKQTETLVIEKEIEKKNIETDHAENKKQSAKNYLFKKNINDTIINEENKTKIEKKIKPKIQFEATKVFYNNNFENEKTEQTKIKNDNNNFTKNNTNIEKNTILSENIKTEEKINTINEISQIENKISYKIKENNPILKTNNKNKFNIENSNQTNKKATFKTRLKIIFFGSLAVLACMIGWTIGNSIEIKTLTSELEKANKIYSVNVVSHISNISKADDLTNEDSIFDLEKLSQAGIVPLTPTEKDSIPYSVKSNWFDRLCNWLSSLFN